MGRKERQRKRGKPLRRNEASSAHSPHLIGRGGVRTRTGFNSHRILSPMRLPVSPLGLSEFLSVGEATIEVTVGRLWRLTSNPSRHRLHPAGSQKSNAETKLFEVTTLSICGVIRKPGSCESSPTFDSLTTNCLVGRMSSEMIAAVSEGRNQLCMTRRMK